MQRTVVEVANERSSPLTLLSTLLFSSNRTEDPKEVARAVANYDGENYRKLLELASSHHVIMRTFPYLQDVLLDTRNPWAEWLAKSIAAERARIANALFFLAIICRTLGRAGDVVVIKSLDHWPDLGSDLDLYTNANVADVMTIMRVVFHASVAAPSWGDRLANKWNFIVPGLPELVEIHFGRLGQTGELDITHSLVTRSCRTSYGLYGFRVPNVEERIVVSTLQRMYRHFYLRLCDIVDTAQVLESGAIDYRYMRRLGQSAGIWEGLCSYLAIVTDYAGSRGMRLTPLPSEVMAAAQLGTADLSFKGKFFRIPLFPQAALLYAKEWLTLLAHGKLGKTLRLTLLPGLGLAAAVASITTGTDKGIW